MASAIGSLIATFAQGVVLGTFIQGFEVEGRAVRRHVSFDWFTPFSLLTGVGAAVRLRAARRRLAGA